MRASLLLPLVLLAGLTAASTGCRSRAQREGRWIYKTFTHAVSGAGRADSKGPLDLRELLPFEWDRMIVLPPYSSPPEIEQKLGFPFEDVKSSRSQLEDRYLLLIFVKGDEVAAWLDIPRDRSDLTALVDLGYIARADAVFSVRGSTGRRMDVRPRVTTR